MPEKKTKLFVYLDPANAEWLDKAVANLKRDRQRTNRSELINLAVSSLKTKDQSEVKEILQKKSKNDK